MIGKPLTRTIVCVALGALIGAGLGAWAGSLTVQHQDHAETARMASTYMSRADILSNEAVNALEEVQTSIVPLCSDMDVARLRNIVLASHFLKAVSRLQNRHLVCSSTLGKLTTPAALPEPDLVSDQGRGVILNAELYGIPGSSALVIEQGNAAVVVNHDAYSALIDPRLDYTIVADYNRKRMIYMQSGPPIEVDGLLLKSGEPIVVNKRRYEVRCSDAHTGCIIAALKAPTTLPRSPVFIGFALLGLLAGMGSGIGVSSVLTRMNSLGRKLRVALKSDTLTVMYQPIVRLSDRERTGAEALVRWTDMSGKAISPDVFITVAEEEGFICDITRFVVRKVVSELGDALRERPEFQITVNMSARDLLDHTFPAFVRHTLKTANVPASSIGFEITERSTAGLADIGQGIAHLRQDGHKVYIDDFGTDYSSLSYLAQLHVDAIKLDRSFVHVLHGEEAGGSIAPQLVAMIRSLGLTLVIEGVEEEAQADYFLAQDPSALAQGWLFGRPVSADRLFDAPVRDISNEYTT